MTMLQNANAISAGGYDINNSLRFRSSASAYLSRTPASAGNRQTWTASFWMKKGALGTSPRIFSTSDLGSNDFAIDFSGDSLNLWGYVGATVQLTLTTTAVYRDPSAWYHVVVVIDTTQATASNRAKIYVNGSQVTAFSTATYPAQNTSFLWNSTAAARIGIYQTGSSAFDGYIAEMHFIDGQALTPSSFGETDAVTGVWKAKKYTGTYGTNGFYLPFKAGSASSYAGSFNGSSQYLSSSTSLFNYTTANASTQTATIEAMVYLNSYQTPSQTYYSPCIAGKGDVYMNLGVNGSGNLIFYHYDGTARNITGSSVIPLNTWTYVAVVISGGTATLYVNGTSVGSGTWYGIQSAGQNSTSYFGRAATNASALYLNGYISNLRVSSTARTISTPSAAYSNDANTNFLTLQSSTVVDNSTNAYAITNTGTVTTSVSYPFYITSVSADYSGNGNNWTSNNIQVAISSTTYDAMTDSPTNTSETVANYATLNPLDTGSNITLSAANLQTSQGASAGISKGTIGISSGKWYWEVTLLSGTTAVGIADITSSRTQNYVGQASTSYGYYSGTGNKYNNATGSSYGASYTTNDVIGVALDMDAGTLTFYKNNTSQGTAYSSLSGTFTPAIGNDQSNTTAFNAGQRPFSYTPPTGYKALNTYNLPTPTILQGNKYMDATLYTGTGTTLNVVNAGQFKPDFVWVKQRSGVVRSHRLEDSVRGATKALYSDLTDAETTEANSITAFNSNGFSVNSQNGVGNSAETYVGWQWQAGQGSTSSNTSGSITSTVSVNASAGFSVVTYTGTQTTANIGHGLGIAPKFIICKNRIDGATNWRVYHASIGAGNYLNLNGTNASTAGTGVWGNTTPTSTVFYVNNDGGTNGSGQAMVAYCWAEIAGFSKFGSYTGNGSTDGTFVYTGFRPKFVMVKKSSSTGSWAILDSTRNTYNVANTALYADLSNAENTTYEARDYLSNGFKLRTTDQNSNENGSTFIYMAFAENPFRNSLAR